MADVFAFIGDVLTLISVLVALWAIKKAYDTIQLSKDANVIARQARREERAMRDLNVYDAVDNALEQLSIASAAGATEIGAADFLAAKRRLASRLVPLGTTELANCRAISADATKPAAAMAGIDLARREVAEAIEKARKVLIDNASGAR